MRKTKIITDNTEVKEDIDIKGFGDTHIKIFEKDTHGAYKLRREGKNKIVLTGSNFLMNKVINKVVPIQQDSYNAILNLDKNQPVLDGNGKLSDEIVTLIAISDTGCGADPRQVFPVEYVSKFDQDKIIPFRIIDKTANDLNHEQRREYFGKKTVNDSYIYYFKKYSEEPRIFQTFLDGTPIDRNIYVSNRKDQVQSYIRYTFNITKEDLKEYFEKNNILDRRISSVSLLTATRTIINEDGVEREFYQNIRPMTIYNFSFLSLNNDGVEINIVYDQYY